MAKDNHRIYIGFFVTTKVDEALKERAEALESDKSKLVRQAINSWLLKNKPVKVKG